MAVFQIEGEEVIDKTVGPGGSSAQIYLNKKYVRRKVKVVILSENENGHGKPETPQVQGVGGVQRGQGDKDA